MIVSRACGRDGDMSPFHSTRRAAADSRSILSVRRVVRYSRCSRKRRAFEEESATAMKSASEEK